MTKQPIISFKNVYAGYNNQEVLKDLSFDIEAGEFVYLVGPTGVGKSTVLKLMYADSLPQSGDIEIEKFNLSALRKSEIPYLRRRIGIVFQNFRLLDDRNVFDNISFGLKATGWKGIDRIKKRVMEVLVDVGMSSKAQSMPHQLSGGQQQRVAIARALINYPVILVADEPTGNLDPLASQKIMEILRKINYSGTSVLMATHEYQLIKNYPARILELQHGGSLKEHVQAHSFLSQILL